MRSKSSARSLIATSSVIARTLMPFLYQTKTLSTFPAIRSKVSSLSRRAAQIQSRNALHTSSALRHGSSSIPDIPVRRRPNPHEGPIEGQSEDSMVIRKVIVDRPAKVSHDVPWEEDLQSQGNGRRRLTTQRDTIPFKNGEDLDDTAFSAMVEPFADETMFDEELEDSGYSSGPAARPARESTITIAEKHAFERIFADILARSKSSSSASISRDMPPDPVQKENATKMLGSIMDIAVKTERARRASAGHSKTKTRKELMAAVEQYPPPLRAAAAKAIGFVQERSQQPLQDDLKTAADDLERLRQPERDKVEGLMRAATTDIELWQVMEQEVFSLVGRLGLEEKPTTHPVQSKKPRSRKRGKRAAETEATPETPESSSVRSAQPLDLTMYGPLYPSHLLLGLRLLDRSFVKPSPLVLNVLPRIKSLGIVSQVLGASTSLYNELLRIYWYRYDDFLRASSLLSEMDQAGLDPDQETLNIVNDISLMQYKVRRGDKGPTLQALWSMPEFAPGKFRAWKDRIQASIKEQTAEVSDEVAWKG